MGCLFLILSVVCFFLFPPLGILLFLIGIVVLLMGIAGNTQQSKQKIAASQTPIAILKSEILRCTDPAAQTVLEGKLLALEEQEREAYKKRLIVGGVIGVLILILLMIGHSPSPSPSYTTSTSPTYNSTSRVVSTPEPMSATMIPDSSPYINRLILKDGHYIDAPEPAVTPTAALPTPTPAPTSIWTKEESDAYFHSPSPTSRKRLRHHN